MHYKTIEKRYRLKEFYKSVQSKSRFVIYKIKIGRFYYIGSSTNLKNRLTIHRGLIKRVATIYINNGNYLFIKSLPFHVKSGIYLSKYIDDINDKLKNMKVDILYKGNDIENRYKKENCFILRSLGDKYCLNENQSCTLSTYGAK